MYRIVEEQRPIHHAAVPPTGPRTVYVLYRDAAEIIVSPYKYDLSLPVRELNQPPWHPDP